MKIKHATIITPGSTFQLGGIAGAKLNGTDVSVNDNILDINAATAVKLNDTTYNVDNEGVIDLGNIGGSEPNDANLHISLNNSSLGDFTANSSTDTSVNINAATSVTVNTSTTYNVSTNGNIDLGEVAKTITFQGQIYHPNNAGQVQLPQIYTVKNGSIIGGSLSQNNATSDISSKVNPIGYLNCSHNTSPSSTIPTGWLLNWNGEYIYCIVALKSLNISSNYNYTCQLYCEVFGGKSGVTIYPHLPKSITTLTSNTIKFSIAIKGLTNDTKPKNYAFSTTTTTTSSYSLSIDYYEGESSNVAPTNLITNTGITESGVYTIDYEVVNNEVTSYVVTKNSGGGQANDGVLTLNLNNSSIGQFTANQSLNTSINVNACTSITVNSSTYNVDSQGNINVGTISGGGTTAKSSIYGTMLCSNNSTNVYNNYTNPIAFIEHLHKAQNFANQALHVNFTDGSFFMKWRVTNFNVTSVSPFSFDATLRLSVTADVNTDNIYTIYPVADVWTQNNYFIGCFIFGLPSDKSRYVVNYALYENCLTENTLPSMTVYDNTTSVITNISTFSGIPLAWGTKDYVLSMSVSNNVASNYQLTTI